MSLGKSTWALLSIAAGIAAAILSPALELATGRPEPYLFVLTALIILAWLATPLNRRSLGFTAGTIRLHAVAAIYPFVILGSVAAFAMLEGNASLQEFSAAEAGKKMLIMTAATWVGVLITEEGFFRGALWGMSEKAGWSAFSVLAWTSVAFMLWHFAVPLIEEDFALPTEQIPVYLVNATLLGFTWGALRLISGSVLVACTAHGFWNGITYILFGYGQKSGALSIADIGVFGPERGYVGIAVNLAVAMALLYWVQRRGINLREPLPVVT
jgi:membrane protease YdiL (CAAX protease family)